MYYITVLVNPAFSPTGRYWAMLDVSLRPVWTAYFEQCKVFLSEEEANKYFQKLRILNCFISDIVIVKDDYLDVLEIMET